MIEIDPIRKFIKTPELGDIIKVYLNNETSIFGRYISKEIGMSKERRPVLREIACIKKVKRKYDLAECKFCFSENIVKIIN